MINSLIQSLSQSWSHPNWGNLPHNTSTLVPKQLDSTRLEYLPIPTNLKSTNHQGVPVDITFLPVECNWNFNLRVVPEWHSKGEWDAIVNFGENPKNQEIFIEKLAYRLGYGGLDTDGQGPPAVEGGRGVKGSVDQWYSTVDSGNLKRYLAESWGIEKVLEHGAWIQKSVS